MWTLTPHKHIVSTSIRIEDIRHMYKHLDAREMRHDRSFLLSYGKHL
jgi:rubrerythrin